MTSRASFLSFPYEIREHIYTAISDFPTFNTYDQNPPPHNMLLVNRQIHDEFAKIYYASNIFHLRMRHRNANGHETPDISGLAEWTSRSVLMLNSIREVMVHFHIFFRSDIPHADYGTSDLHCWLAAGLAMAPNVEILHIVFLCTQPATRTTFLPNRSNAQHDTVTRSVLEAIPWIKDCCTLPNLLRVALHVDSRHGNEIISCFAENMKGCEWVKSFSRSLVSHARVESHFSEHIFKVHRTKEARRLNDLSLTDIFCILHPISIAACVAIAEMAKVMPSSTITTTGVEVKLRGGSKSNIVNTADLVARGIPLRAIALRFSADLKQPLLGFCFGRKIQRCDFAFSNVEGAQTISNIHFRIHIDEQSRKITLEDQSTNGTLVDDVLLRGKDKENGATYKHILQHGSLITLMISPEEYIRFVVQIPQHIGEYESGYH